MKRMFWLVLCLAAAAAVAFSIAKRNSAPAASVSSQAEPASTETTDRDAPESEPALPAKKFRARRIAPDDSVASAASPPAVAAAVEPVSEELLQLRRSVDQLVSPQTSFQQKYATWTQLRDAGKLNQVIAELEQRATNNPASAEYPAALGQAYIHQIATTKDTRQYALLGLKADQSFDTALELDPANWEARFFKALAMSYWPTEMNRGDEVIQRFTRLIQDQEQQTAQPHFAQSYVWLGEQYQKTGHPDYAEQVWRRGAELFPAEPMLQQKLAGQ